MRLHERERPCLRASADLRTKVGEWLDEHPDLTDLETHAIILDVLSSELGQYFKFQIRYERHGNFDTPGGAAA